MKRALYLLPILFLSACGAGGTRPPNPGDHIPKPSGPPDGATLFEVMAYWGSGMAGLAVLIGIIVLWSRPKLGQQIIVTAISVLVGAQIMLWIGAHLMFISLVTLIVGLAYVGYKHKEEIVDAFDGDTEKIQADPIPERNIEYTIEPVDIDDTPEPHDAPRTEH